jgi:DNA-binding CsgD family transcriptional regulator
MAIRDVGATPNTSYLWHAKATIWRNITRCRQKVAYKQSRQMAAIWPTASIAAMQKRAPNPRQLAGCPLAVRATDCPHGDMISAAPESTHVRSHRATPNWEVTGATPASHKACMRRKLPEMPQTVFLKEEFGLTPAEARLVLQLIAGESLRSAAKTLNVGYETARTTLKSVFHKTGTCRQAELVIVVINAMNIVR